MRQVGATLHRSAQASYYRSLSCCGAQAPEAQAQQLWLTGLVAPRHVGSSQTRARTRVPCIGRQTLNHCATREALNSHIYARCFPNHKPLPLFCFPVMNLHLPADYFRLDILYKANMSKTVHRRFPVCLLLLCSILFS